MTRRPHIDRAGTKSMVAAGEAIYVCEGDTYWFTGKTRKEVVNSVAHRFNYYHPERHPIEIKERAAKLIDIVDWYIECRELEGIMYYINFFEPVNQETLSDVSTLTDEAMKAMKDAVGYKSTDEDSSDK